MLRRPLDALVSVAPLRERDPPASGELREEERVRARERSRSLCFAQADAPPLAAPAMPERRYVTIMRHPVGRIVSAFYHSVSNHNAEHVRASGELRNRFRR